MNSIKIILNNYPIFSMIISILLFLGLNQLGTLIFRNKSIHNIVSEISSIEYQKIIIAGNFIMIILLPIILLNIFSYQLILISSLALIILGIIQFLIFIRKYKYYYEMIKKIKIDDSIIFLFLFIYFLLSLSPITHADALDYHMSIAKFISKNGTFPTDLNNLHNLFSGSGEIMMSLSFIYGSEQLGNLIQFSGLLCLIGIVKKNNNENLLFSIAILSTPVIIFLCSSPKPQLFSIASNTLIFALIFFRDKYKILNLNKKNLFYLSSIILIFLINSVNTKFSFMLSSGIIYFIALKLFYDLNFIKYFILISLTFAVLFYFPFIFWKYYNWGGEIYNYVLSPYPINLPGIENFRTYLLGSKDDFSILDLIIPQNLGNFTRSIGMSFLFLFFIIKLNNRLFFSLLLIIIFYLFIVFQYGQISARFLIEPLFWILVILSKEKNLSYNFVKFPIYIQAFVVFSFITYGTFNLFPGSLSAQNYKNVMTKNANGYSLINWTEEKIGKNTSYLTIHRSTGLSQNAISTTFLYYADLDSEIHKNFFLNFIYNKKPKYLVMIDSLENASIFKNCVVNLLFFEKNIGHKATRNPMNIGKPYDGYIYSLKDLKKTKCFNK